VDNTLRALRMIYHRGLDWHGVG